MKLRIGHRLILLSSLIATTSAALAQDAWPVQRGDEQSQGTTASKMPATPKELWKFEVPGSAFDAPPIIAEDHVFICDSDGEVHCLSLADGSEIWQNFSESGYLAAAAYHDRILVVCDYDGFVHGLSAADGKELWQFETGAQIDSGANFYKDLALVTSEDGLLYALNFKDGTLKWEYETGDQLRCSPTIAANHTFLGGCDGVLHVVDLDSGRATGMSLPLGSPTGSTPAVDGTFAAIATHGGTISAFDWEKGVELWRFADVDLTQEFRSSPALSSESIFVTPRNKRLLALDRKTGDLKWQYVLRKRADASPVLADGRVWIATTDGQLIAVEENTGEMTWSEQRTGAFLSSVAIAQNRLVVANDRGVVYCFGE